MSITAKELAKKLNLSATAVSMALNNKPGVSTETRNRIIKAAEQYGYDFTRLSSKSSRTGDIYCVIYRAHNALLNYTPIFTELIDGMEQECQEQGYKLKLLQINEKIDNVQKYIEDIRISNCAGIILLGTETTMLMCKMFMQLSVPLVLLDSYFDALDCSSVLINNAQATYLATNYLIDRYNSHPGYLRSTYMIGNFRERRRGFDKAIREHGMSATNSIVHDLSPSIDGAFSDMLEIIEAGDTLSRCYLADNDLIAIGALKALKSRGYRVPHDIAIAGFDNISEGNIVEPSLTTVDIPRKYMGQTAVRQLIYQITTPIPHTVKIQISTKLVKRISA